MSESDFRARLPGPVTARPRRPLSNSASTASWKHSLLVVDDDLGRAEVEQPLQPVVPVDDAAVEVVEVARGERPPSSWTIGRSSGGITGTASMTIHSGLFSGADERVHDLQPLRSLAAASGPFDVAIVAATPPRRRGRDRAGGRGSPRRPCRRGSTRRGRSGEPKYPSSRGRSCPSLTTIFGLVLKSLPGLLGARACFLRRLARCRRDAGRCTR